MARLVCAGIVAVLMSTEPAAAAETTPAVPWRKDFKAALREARTTGKPVMVDFWAKWCKPCEAIEPHLEAVASAHGIPLVKVDIDTQPGIASRYGVLSLPTVVLLVGGEPRETVYGAQPRARYEQAVAAHVTAN